MNAVRRPGEWQSYDIVFEAPRFEGGTVAKPAYLTVFLNGVLLHNRKELMGPTVHRALANYAPQPAEDALVLQDHQQPVRYRNIWIRRLRGYDRRRRGGLQTRLSSDVVEAELWVHLLSYTSPELTRVEADESRYDDRTALRWRRRRWTLGSRRLKGCALNLADPHRLLARSGDPCRPELHTDSPGSTQVSSASEREVDGHTCSERR